MVSFYTLIAICIGRGARLHFAPLYFHLAIYKIQEVGYNMSTIKIISDGTVDGTKVLDANGNVMENVQAAYVLAIAGEVPCALLKIKDVEVDMTVPDDDVFTEKANVAK